jgi:hypothetical protein
MANNVPSRAEHSFRTCTLQSPIIAHLNDPAVLIGTVHLSYTFERIRGSCPRPPGIYRFRPNPEAVFIEFNPDVVETHRRLGFGV